GMIFCVIIVWLSNSGGPTSALGVAILGWLLWRIRMRMKLFRWGIVAGLAGLALVMKAPVWYILDRVSAITGGTGWHRSYLIDVAIRHLGQWWLAGMSISDTSDWFPYTIVITGGADITNQFLIFGLAGGLVSMALLIAMLYRAFSALGIALDSVRS